MAQLALNEETLLTALDAWDLAPPISVGRLPGGFTSDVWHVETGNERYIAKYTELPQAAFESGLRAAATAELAGIPSGAPLPTRAGALSIPVTGVHGKDQPLALLQYVPGDPLDLSEQDAATLYGHLLGRTHRLMLDRIDRSRLPRLDAFLFQHADYVSAQPGLRTLIERALETAQAYEAHHSMTHGAIWGDRMEVLRERETSQIGIIDWGALQQGPLAFDVALSLLWLFPEGTPAADEFCRAYLAAGPIPASELDALPCCQALFWARQAKYFAYRIAAGVILGDSDPEGNTRRLAEAREHLEQLLNAL